MSYIISMHDKQCRDPKLTGGKGSSLAVLAQIPGVKVPPFYCVSTDAFVRTFEKTRLADLTTDLQKQTEWPDIDRVSKSIREFVRNEAMDADISEQISSAYLELQRAMSSDVAVSVAVRSSATTEDTASASFAGQHSTYLNQVGVADVVRSVRRCWASAFNARACEYRNRFQIPHLKALVCVVVQVMVQPQCAGTAFSVDLGTGYPGLHVAACYGLGEGLVSGEVTSDEWLFGRRNTGYRLVKRTLGTKRSQYRFNQQSSGIELVPVDAQAADQFCLPLETARAIASTVQVIEEEYKNLFGYAVIDTELAVTSSQQIFFLQARPVVNMGDREIQTVDAKAVFPEDVVVSGCYSLLGAVHGKVKLVENFDLLVEGKITVDADDIVVAVKTGNAWTQYLKHLKGIVTVEGSPTSHPMLIGRERNIPCVIGCPDAIINLKPFDGEWVTLDGLKKKVFQGKQPLVTATTEELRSLFDPPKPPQLPSDEDSRKFLQSFSRGYEEGGFFWVGIVEHGLSPFWATMNGESLRERAAIMKVARGDQFDTTKLLCDEFRIVKSKDTEWRVFDQMVPIAVTMKLFENLTLAEATTLITERENWMNQYLSACAKFEKTGSLVAWHEYVHSYKMFAAHKWLSWFFRTHLEHEVTRTAIQLNCSQFHLERMMEAAQRRAVGDDWDLFFYREVARIAIIDAISSDEIVELATSYKIAKNTDISSPIPLDILNSKIAERKARARKQFSGSGSGLLVSGEYGGVVENDREEYFPENPDFMNKVELVTRARRQHCNSHHLLVRGQWKVRAKLIEIYGPGVFSLSKEELEAKLSQ